MKTTLRLTIALLLISSISGCGFFERILPLPHPRWVMQYRRKRKEEFVGQYLGVLG